MAQSQLNSLIRKLLAKCLYQTVAITIASSGLFSQVPAPFIPSNYSGISELLSEYVKRESISGNEFVAGEFFSDYCRQKGLFVRHLTKDTSSYNFCASLYPLELRKPNILLLNHIDVVPEGKLEDWKYPPYSGEIVDGSVWGRGSVDNKGMGVMQVYALQQFVERAGSHELPFNVTLLSVSSEEVGGELGAKVVTERFLEELNPILVLGEGGSGIEGIVSSDPNLTVYGISIAAKRMLWLKLKCKLNSSGHGSVPPDADANKIMIRALERINSKIRPIELSPATKTMFVKLGKMEGGLKGFALRNIGFFKPFIGSALREEAIIYALVSNTATHTNISNPPGATNKISEEVEATLDCRLLPETDKEEFIKYLKEVMDEELIEIEIMFESPGALGSKPGIFYKLLENSLLDVYPDAKVAPILFPATNDNNYFRAKGIPAYGILPVKMNKEMLESIHSNDENMPVDLLVSGSRVYYSFIEQLFSTAFGTQALTQNIRGTIIDKTSQVPLTGCIVVVSNDTSILGAATTNVVGKFEIPNVPIGRHKVKVFDRYYKELEVHNVVLGTGRETILELSLEAGPAAELVYTGLSQDLSINEMALVSTHTFAVEEIERYAGSRGDPSRMVANFAGVRGLDDTRNDIIIRGNTPSGLLYNLEGISISNPNHYALYGSTGGGVNIISNKVLQNSDFISGAMPAEYGNAIAGVFDLQLRSGNNQQFEVVAETGILTSEIVAEGPIGPKGGASFLVDVRSSTFGLMDLLNRSLAKETAKVVGLAGIPKFRDLAFKLNWPLKDRSNISLFGIGGKSDIQILEVDRDPCFFSFEDHNQNVDFGTGMGIAGINYDRSLNEKTHARISLYTSGNTMYSFRDLVIRDSLSGNVIGTRPKYRNDFSRQEFGVRFVFNSKLDSRHSLRYGLTVKEGFYDLVDSLSGISTTDFQGIIWQSNLFAQWMYKFSNTLTITSGFHSLFFGLNGSLSFEPRAAVKWDFRRNQSIAFAAGLHSALQPTYIYFQLSPDSTGRLYRHNQDLGMTHSQHYVISYFNRFNDNIRLVIEGYYQRLTNVPVEKEASSFSMLNDGINFKYSFPGKLKNGGVGENFGLEATLERFYNKGYYYFLTFSWYNSQYEGSDLVRRNTDFNGNFAFNGLIGREFTLGQKKNIILGTGLRVSYAGGRRYTPLDLEASIEKQEKVTVDSLAFTNQFPNYFRTDLKLTLTINRPKFSHEFGLDLLNIVPIRRSDPEDDRPIDCRNNWGISTLNPLSITFDPSSQSIRREYQLSFLPVVYYRLEL